MAVTALLTPLAALLPHTIQRFAAVPMGLALIGLEYVLWTGQADNQRVTPAHLEGGEMEP